MNRVNLSEVESSDIDELNTLSVEALVRFSEVKNVEPWVVVKFLLTGAGCWLLTLRFKFIAIKSLNVEERLAREVSVASCTFNNKLVNDFSKSVIVNNEL